MKLSLFIRIAAYSLLVLSCNFVFAAATPPGYPPGLYDEGNVPKFTLPDPLVMLNGDKVKDIDTWKQKRRPEILKLFETNVYGRNVVGRPDGMTWKVIAENRSDMNGIAITKTVTIYFTGKDDGPKMDVNFVLPAGATKKPVPIFLVPGWVRSSQLLLNHGFGLANFNPNQVEPDNKDGYPKSIRKFFAKPDQNTPGPDEWGAIGAWAWAMSRAMDYIVTDKDIDANKVCIMGVSRYGKVAMWAGAQDQRFAITYSCVSGCGGIVIVRRGFGETVKGINNMFPYWFCRNFRKFGSRINDLPVDWHMLVSLMAPRPIYISTAEQDLWTDPRGSFLSGKYAEPVYQLFGEKGLSVDDMPPVETPVGDFIGYHNRKGTHGLTDYDWQQFLNFADRHLGLIKIKE
ncbi:MAG: acetylxylan esterase [Sedimentisphaerales bacterium]